MQTLDSRLVSVRDRERVWRAACSWLRRILPEKQPAKNDAGGACWLKTWLRANCGPHELDCELRPCSLLRLHLRGHRHAWESQLASKPIERETSDCVRDAPRKARSKFSDKDQATSPARASTNARVCQPVRQLRWNRNERLVFLHSTEVIKCETVAVTKSQELCSVSASNSCCKGISTDLRRVTYEVCLSNSKHAYNGCGASHGRPRDQPSFETSPSVETGNRQDHRDKQFRGSKLDLRVIADHLSAG